MYEVEVKVRAAHAPVRERLAALDAERVGRVSQSDTYYDAPHREFAETDEALRTRRETRLGAGDDEASGTDGDGTIDGGTGTDGDPGAGVETRITYKGPLVEAESKTREEHETAVDDPAAARGILDGLGFDPAATVEKRRDSYAVGEYTVTLDAVDGLGEFVEVERTVEEADIESAREGAHALLRDLELDPDEGIRTSYLGLLLDADDRPEASGDAPADGRGDDPDGDADALE